jgi:hypothetical protein
MIKGNECSLNINMLLQITNTWFKIYLILFTMVKLLEYSMHILAPAGDCEVVLTPGVALTL